MPNTLLNVDKITNAALVILHQKVNFIGSINRDYDNSFAQSGAKIGDTLRIRLPNQFTVRTGAAMSSQDVVETNTSLTVSSQKGVDCNFTTKELALNIFDFSQQFLEPAMAVLAANIESDALSMMNSVYNTINGAGSAQTYRNVLLARKALVDNLAPMDSGRQCRLDTQSNVDLADSLKGLFQNQEAIKRQYNEGKMGVAGGLEFAENTLLAPFSFGSRTTAYTVNGAGQTGASVVVQTGTGTVAVGDVFTLAGCFRVHPETKVSTGVLQQFVCTAAYAGGGGTMSISPSIVTTGPTQNVSASPTTSGAVTFVGTLSTTTQQSIAYHKDAFTFATADLMLPDGVQFAARKMMDGLSLRIIRQYDINNDKMPCRMDILYGYKAIRPQLACRMLSN